VKASALAAHTPEAVRAALAARGWDADPARFAAIGMQSVVLLLEDITETEREALVRWSTRAGSDVLTGEGWAVVAAAASRLAPLGRHDRTTADLEGLIPELVRVFSAWADPARELVFVGLTAGLIDEARSILRWHQFSDLAQACVVY